MHAGTAVVHTQKCHLWARPQSRQHLLRFWLFTHKQSGWTDEKRSHVAVNTAAQERQRYLEIKDKMKLPRSKVTGVQSW